MSERSKGPRTIRWLRAVPALAFTAMSISCANDTPTGLGESLFPLQPRTIEVRLPWSEFGVALEVFGGYGRATEAPAIVLAEDYQGELDARVIAAFAYPTFVEARDTTGVLRNDSLYTPIGGRLVARFDSIDQEEFQLEAGLLFDAWDGSTVTWEAAVDSLGEFRAWQEPGAGPVTPVGTGEWIPGVGDSLSIQVDSLTARAWGDTTQFSGVRLDLGTPERLVRLTQLTLHVDTRPSVDPDTTVTFTAFTGNVAFIYSPSPSPPTGELRMGGAPAWRTIMTVDVPSVIDGPPSLCEQVTCPFVIDPERVNFASISLTPTPPQPGFRPVDTLQIDARAVLAPELLPKSPLGMSQAPGGVALPSELFEESAGGRIEIPVTSFIEDILLGETASGEEPLTSIALLDLFEPRSFPFAAFAGPGQEGEPVLRMIVTTSDTVELR